MLEAPQNHVAATVTAPVDTLFHTRGAAYCVHSVQFRRRRLNFDPIECSPALGKLLQVDVHQVHALVDRCVHAPVS